jgi:hypothetical protein
VIIDKHKKSGLSVDDEFIVPSVPVTIYKDFNKIHSRTIDELQSSDSASNNDLFLDKIIPNNETTSILDQLGTELNVIAQFPFTAEYPNELSFEAGQIIKLIQYIDNEWAEGMIDNIRGIFPVSFVELQYIKSNDVGENNIHMVENMYQSNDYKAVNVFRDELITKQASYNTNSINLLKFENGIYSNNLGIHFNLTKETFPDAFEELVLTRNEKENIECTKKISEPHRSAPSAPILGEIPLENQKHFAVSLKEENKNSSSKYDQRQNVITELYLTEKDYVRDLKMTYRTFNLHDPSFLKSKGIDVTTLFGNISEIIEIGEELLELIEQVMNDCNEQYQCVGSCFLKISDKMRIAYGKYCSNHELSLVLLQKVVFIFNKIFISLK